MVGPSRHQLSVVFRERVYAASSVERDKVAEYLSCRGPKRVMSGVGDFRFSHPPCVECIECLGLPPSYVESDYPDKPEHQMDHKRG